MTPQVFAAKWKGSTQTERAAAQEHFLDICSMLDVTSPNAADPTGEWYAFEKGAKKQSGQDGFADVWKRKYFAWEYKRKKKDLKEAYKQLSDYREALENPPLLVVCDLNRFEVHTNFTGTIKKVYEFDLDDFAADATEPLRVLRGVLTDPDSLKPDATREQLTELAAQDFAKLAFRLDKRGHEPHEIAHFLNRLTFCLFAEDAGLLPANLLEGLAENTRLDPPAFAAGLQDLFSKMSHGGGLFGAEKIDWFNGGLFDSDEVLLLETLEIDLLRYVGQLDWSQIEPAIFGTLFERGLDPNKRAQLGAHYTHPDEIARVVEPVLMMPLRREFDAMKQQVELLLSKGTPIRMGKGRRAASAPVKLFENFLERLRSVRVLDPACGSGNFLYIALRSVKDLEREALAWGALVLNLSAFPQVGPSIVAGLEVNEYAAELARVTIWIGHIQWMIQNGYSYERDPILKPLDNIKTTDALLTVNESGAVDETAWPDAEFIIGNPPFLGSRLLRRRLGHEYVERLFRQFGGRVPGAADLVVYWHEKARAMVEEGRARRVGLLATQGIRGGKSRTVLERMKETGDIFAAWSDEPWVLDGAAVRVSIICFDDGSEPERFLDGEPVLAINSDLTSGLDLTEAVPLKESTGIAHYGDVKGGPFEITDAQAKKLLAQPNPDGRKNDDVVRPWINALDLTRRPRNMWIIDFGYDMSMEEAAKYEGPFEYVKKVVKPVRDEVRRKKYREIWWIHSEPVKAMRAAIATLPRYIVTPQTSKHRIFGWVDGNTIADHAVVVIATSDDYLFGVLHSRFHQLWALRKGTQLEDRPRYTPTTTVETYPFPEAAESQARSIAELAAELDKRRRDWLNPPQIGGAELEVRTLTNLYNDPPTWLQMLHEKLDAAVADAYGWPPTLSDDEALAQLLDLNKARAAKPRSGPVQGTL